MLAQAWSDTVTPKNSSESTDDDSLGVLDDAASLDTTNINALGHTAQVSVELPRDQDDDLVDDSVIDGEVHSELIVDPAPVPDDFQAPSEEPVVHATPAPRNESATSAWILNAMKHDAVASSSDEVTSAS